MNIDAWLPYELSWMPLDTIARLLIAILAGAALGWERERHDKPAGLRTHMLVSLGAAAFMIGAIEFSAAPGNTNAAIRLDPMRALAGIIGGVGFLGAGTIIQARGSVRGITTAASIWVCAAIGTCSGLGLYQVTLWCGILALAVLWGVGLLEHHALNTKRARGTDESPCEVDDRRIPRP